MKLRLLSLLMVLAMLVTCFVACKDDKTQKDGKDAVSTDTEESGKNENASDDVSAEDGEVSSENNGNSEFDELSNIEKLLYFTTPELDEDELLNKVCTVLNVNKEELFIPTVTEGNVFEVGVNVDINELTVDGEDALQSMGGSMGIDASFVTDGSAVNLNAGMSMPGMSINFVDAKLNGVAGSVSSPLFLEKSVYVDFNALTEALLTGSDFFDSNGLFGDTQNVLTALEDAAALFTSIGTKIVELIPEDSVTSAMESIEGKYAGKVEAECVALTLDNEDLASMIKGLYEAYYGDESFKETAVSVLEAMDSLLDYAAQMGADVPAFEAAELYETVFEYLEEAREEIAESEPIEIVIKRFFVDGKNVSFDINVTAEGETLAISAMDITVGEACDFAVSASFAGVDMLNLSGGYKGEKSSFSMGITNPEGDLDLDDNGEYVSAPELIYSVSMEKDGDTVITITKTTEGETVYKQTGEKFESNITYDDGRIGTMEGTIVKDGIDMTYDAKFSLDGSEMEIKVVTDNEMTATKYSSKMSILAQMGIEGSLIVLDAELGAFVDLDSDAEIEEPKQGKNDYVVDGLDDLQEIVSALSEMLSYNLDLGDIVDV
ncbi:MAG: hypothetical protein IJB76_05450 [Clostridia bacterium]|nr:hypothetical protein [Clostridia bacterium]